MKLEVCEAIGNSEASNLYRGLLLPGGRPVAVKRFRANNPESLKQLFAEAEVMARLDDPSIVGLLAVQDNLADPCLVVELVDGIDLRALLPQAPLSTAAALYIGRAIFKALAYAHDAGVYHGCLSPAMILLSRTGEVKLTGFGAHDHADGLLATNDVLLAALPYISPERLQGQAADHRSDMFAAGAILYQLLTGRSPFGTSANGMLRALLQGEYHSPQHYATHLSAALTEILARLLAPHSHRYQSAGAVLDALRDVHVAESGRDELVRHLISVLPPSRPAQSGWYAPSSMTHSNRYDLQEPLGGGGMGEVWRGTRSLDSGPPQVVAFKFMKKRHSSALTIEQFGREARTAMTVHHTNIAAVYDLVEIQGRPCIVMEHIEGVTLGQLAHRGPIENGALRCILLDALSGLRHAHERAILHRDLSPANIMIGRDGIARLMDFGVAKNLEESHSLGMLVGTTPYLAPEALEEQQWSHGSDIYSLGAVFYSVLSGVPPYGTGDRFQILSEMQSRDPAPLPEHAPADLRAFITAALHPVADRLQKAAYLEAERAIEPARVRDRERLAAAVGNAIDNFTPRGPESASTMSPAGIALPDIAHQPDEDIEHEHERQVSVEPEVATSRKSRFLVAVALAAAFVLGVVVADHWREPVGESQPSVTEEQAQDATVQPVIDVPPVAHVPATDVPPVAHVPAADAPPVVHVPPPETAKTATQSIPPKKSQAKSKRRRRTRAANIATRGRFTIEHFADYDEQVQ